MWKTQLEKDESPKHTRGGHGTLRSPDEVSKDTTYGPRSFLAPYTPKVPSRLLLYLFLDTPNLYTPHTRYRNVGADIKWSPRRHT
jgi:hypothetical protein